MQSLRGLFLLVIIRLVSVCLFLKPGETDGGSLKNQAPLGHQSTWMATG